MACDTIVGKRHGIHRYRYKTRAEPTTLSHGCEGMYPKIPREVGGMSEVVTYNLEFSGGKRSDIACTMTTKGYVPGQNGSAVFVVEEVEPEPELYEGNYWYDKYEYRKRYISPALCTTAGRQRIGSILVVEPKDEQGGKVAE